MGDRKCICGNSIEGYHNLAKYCSNQCSREAYNETRRRKKATGRIYMNVSCETCAKPIITDRPSTKFCSKACGATSQRRKKISIPNIDRSKQRNCMSCGSVFKSQHHGNRLCGSCRSRTYWHI